MRKLVEFQILDQNALYYDVDLSELMDNALPGIDPHKDSISTSSCNALVNMYAMDLDIGINLRVPSLGPCCVNAVQP